MFLMLIANTLGIFTLFYLLWKTLKEDYHYEKIFNLSFLTFFGFIFGLLVTSYISKNYWFWISSISIFIGFYIAIKRQKMKFFESFEGLIIGSLFWIGFVYLSDAITSQSLASFLAFWVCSICIFIFFFFKSFYRSFTWYKSGRVGFAGVAIAAIFFIIRSVVSLFFSDIFSFSGKYEIYLSGSVALILFLLLYSLSRPRE